MWNAVFAAQEGKNGVTQVTRVKFQKHISVLVWKSFLQRQRRWKFLFIENLFALLAFFIAVVFAKSVFLTPLTDHPEPTLTFAEILNTLQNDTIVGYAPDIEPYITIMNRSAQLLGISLMAAQNENALNMLLYQQAMGKKITQNVRWILWDTNETQVYKFRIRTTKAQQAATYSDIYAKELSKDERLQKQKNPHLKDGFLALQLAVSHASLERAAYPVQPNYELSLVSMPISPLMEETKVSHAISFILMCYTIALLPPVVETEALVVVETQRRFKRALRIRNVEYLPMYFGWLTYALLTALPICMLGSITLILIFRWIHLMYALITLLFYFLVMMMLALMMALAHDNPLISCVWTISQTLLQTFLAELVHHHEYEKSAKGVMFIVHVILPPLGLLNGLNQFALLQTGHEAAALNSMEYTILSWFFMIAIYFMILVLLNRTLGAAAIGGQVSWKSIIFKKAQDPSVLRPVAKPAVIDGSFIQEVDELTAKAISFRNVHKTIMKVPLLSNVSFDIFRGEYSMLIAEQIQEKLMQCVSDLLTGLTHADSGSINVLGVELCPERNLMTEPMMMGYCDASSFLIDDLTVTEHLNFYTKICLWKESSESLLEYSLIRIRQLKLDYDLEVVKHKMIKDLGLYYKAQLCWAIAMLLEPRIIVIPNFEEAPVFEAVIRDKITKYRKHLSIIKLSRSSMDVEYADRLFLFDNRILAFGGTPAYMFFKYGREYRIRISCKSMEEEDSRELLERIRKVGATVRAHLGSLLIIRMPTSPSSTIAELLTDIEENADQYNVASINLSLPDTEEVFRRAVHQSRSAVTISRETRLRSKAALIRIAEHRNWCREISFFLNLHLRYIGWKYFSFYVHYRFFFIITVMSALIAGASIGTDLANMLKGISGKKEVDKILTVESLRTLTTLVIRCDASDSATSVADSYVISHPGALKAEVDKISYIALPHTQSLTEYLVTQAIDSPQEYVHEHAYGLDVHEAKARNATTLIVKALYSPIHQDSSSAARSLARVYMALMRHYSANLASSIAIVDDPLSMEAWSERDDDPPLLIQFLLVLTISHIAMLPSMEHGLIRHMQKHSLNFSPLGYWLSLAFCDIILYWMLVIVMISVAIIVLLVFQSQVFNFSDLVAVPFMLMIYGFGCVPQAYLFSLGPHPSLNSMALVIINIVFGEATIVARIFYGGALKRTLSFMSVSPQFNMAYALVKIKRTFLHNLECPIFKAKNLCLKKILHRCCPKCGVMQDCFTREAYLSAIWPEITGTVAAATLFMLILLLWEYRAIQLVFNSIFYKIWFFEPQPCPESIAVLREKNEVLTKHKQLINRKAYRRHFLNTFGEFILAVNISRTKNNYHIIRNVHIGIGKGEAIALLGLKKHGRLALLEILAGYKPCTMGRLWAMSKYSNYYSPHKLSSNAALCTDLEPLPPWMSVYDALEMIAVLRGVPKRFVDDEVQDYIEALDLSNQENLLISRLHPSEHMRLNFLAVVVGAPPVLCFDEATSYQNFVVKSAMYHVLNSLRKKGHAILHSGFDLESHLPVTNRTAIMRDGCLFELDYADSLLQRYSNQGYIVVIHVKNEIDHVALFARYFTKFSVNDVSDVLINMQVMDTVSLATMFRKMEKLKRENEQVYSYIVCANSIDYIYYRMISNSEGNQPVRKIFLWPAVKSFLTGSHKKFQPPPSTIANLNKFQKVYSLHTLRGLPWSVIFHQ